MGNKLAKKQRREQGDEEKLNGQVRLISVTKKRSTPNSPLKQQEELTEQLGDQLITTDDATIQVEKGIEMIKTTNENEGNDISVESAQSAEIGNGTTISNEVSNLIENVDSLLIKETLINEESDSKTVDISTPNTDEIISSKLEEKDSNPPLPEIQINLDQPVSESLDSPDNINSNCNTKQSSDEENHVEEDLETNQENTIEALDSGEIQVYLQTNEDYIVQFYDSILADAFNEVIDFKRKDSQVSHTGFDNNSTTARPDSGYELASRGNRHHSPKDNHHIDNSENIRDRGKNKTSHNTVIIPKEGCLNSIDKDLENFEENTEPSLTTKLRKEILEFSEQLSIDILNHVRLALS
uniref:Uncharacterized protein n=1 Tax=Clytia hemisphaerica TaxID=252671 RepID=A0A7M5XEM9_9CNID